MLECKIHFQWALCFRKIETKACKLLFTVYGKQKAMILYKEVFEAKAAHLCGRSSLQPAQANMQQTRALCIAPSTQCAPIWRAGRQLWQDSNFVQILCSSDFWPHAMTHAVPGVAFDSDSTTSFERVSYIFQKFSLSFFSSIYIFISRQV